MFGIGGGELVFIMFIVLMLFGSDKVPEMARTMGKAMAQLKNATNDIKSEIQKGVEVNGLDAKSLSNLTGDINSQINKVKEDLMGDTVAQVNKATSNLLGDSVDQANKVKEDIEDITGPVKRQR
ncbi:Sec-independent protein translocase subunit TatA/TatB [Flavobacterium muglaense]|uniref:Twin-arginine translocase TatA/TatE family subunit n=1 Tax=Flavobacterium muglaense TaxID=2764716 RepID=A0A923N2E7_9FLAO|nr:twin-arginine translocase TatA/TatE family subunit [Flavobacterium muglaense]MBC5839702.1 twin-arginine translocase TatA/TatE family subunit [Flavobacterium muglaense]MBC5846226.1 twin-arginine translocase TatA/TatE family subunit [Flavobacterium muglaense]